MQRVLPYYLCLAGNLMNWLTARPEPPPSGDSTLPPTTVNRPPTTDNPLTTCSKVVWGFLFFCLAINGAWVIPLRLSRMGRYSSLVSGQGESSSAQPTTYSSTATASTLGPASATLETAPRKRRHDEDDVSATGKRLVVNRVENVVSSIAGANSSEFDKYRKTRRREQERLDAIEREHKLEEERNSLFVKVQLNKLEAEERTRRNAERRQRKKLKKLHRTGAKPPVAIESTAAADGPCSELGDANEVGES